MSDKVTDIELRPMDDIEYQLRIAAGTGEHTGTVYGVVTSSMLREAADEIARLREALTGIVFGALLDTSSSASKSGTKPLGKLGGTPMTRSALQGEK